MVNWRNTLALGAGAALICSATLFAQGERKLNDAEKKEFQAIVKIVDGPPAGQPASNDLGLAWIQNDLLKAQGNMQYVPFSVSVDTSKLTGKSRLALLARGREESPGRDRQRRQERQEEERLRLRGPGDIERRDCRGRDEHQPVVHRPGWRLRRRGHGEGADEEGKERAGAEDGSHPPERRGPQFVGRRVHDQHRHRGHLHRAARRAAHTSAASRPALRDGRHGDRSSAHLQVHQAGRTVDLRADLQRAD